MTNTITMTNHQHPHPQQRRAVDLRIPAIEKYAYCLCLHVKPTTIFIAVFKLIRALLIASMILNSEFSASEQFADASMVGLEDRHKSTAAAVSILTRIIMASVSAVGIYAVISGKAGLLMPLYAILLVDFFFALPTFYSRDLDPSFADTLDDLRNYSPGNKQYTRYTLMLFSTIVMIVRIYFICVVWKCYRYLRLIELVSPIRLSSEFYPHIHHQTARYPIVRVINDSTDSANVGLHHHSLAPPPYESIASNMKPPNYEEAVKSTNLTMIPTHPAPSCNGPDIGAAQTLLPVVIIGGQPQQQPPEGQPQQVVQSNDITLSQAENDSRSTTRVVVETSDSEGHSSIVNSSPISLTGTSSGASDNSPKNVDQSTTTNSDSAENLSSTAHQLSAGQENDLNSSHKSTNQDTQKGD